MIKSSLSQKYALVTGASSGIGLEFARILASKHYNLVIVSNKSDIKTVSDDLSAEFKIKVIPLILDLATDGSAEKLYDFCQSHHLEISILINNAGMLIFDEIDQIPDTSVKKILKLHITTPTILCKKFGTDMKKRGNGHILIMSSLSAWSSYPGIMLYASTKRYLKDFGKALHYEMKDYDVNVTTICPGAVNTQLYQLSDKYRRLALKLHIMLNPDLVARKSLKKMFRRRVCYLPGVFTKIFRVFLFITSMNTIQFIRHHLPFFKRRLHRPPRP